MKIIFIGAGIASLAAAYELGKAGHEAVVYEAKDEDNIAYDWHDDVNGAAFLKNGLPGPDEGTYFVKKNWSFIPPSERVETTLSIPDEELDLSIERRPLAIKYIERARRYAKVYMGARVDSLFVRDGTVAGVIVDGREELADLTVDASGAMSPFKAQLPEAAKIAPAPDSRDIFVAYRAFYESLQGVEPPANTNRAYLKHLGKEGISWSILDPSGTVNVLIGRVGKLTKEDFNEAFCALKRSNPQIGDKIVRGGITCVIPIRYPSTRLVYDGYALLGDSAFMTVPMIGSGIENSVNAAMTLAETVIRTGSAKKEDLWEYERRYFLDRGAVHIGVDILKRWLLSARPEDIDWLFEKGVISPKDMACGATGKLITLSFSDLLDKVKRGYSRLPLLLKLNGVVNATKKACRLGKAIPKTYDDKKIEKWERKIEALVGKFDK